MVAIHRASDGAPGASHQFASLVRDLNWHASGRWIAVPDYGGAIHILQAQTGETALLGHHKAEAVVAEFTPAGRYLVSRGWGPPLSFWEMKRLQRALCPSLGS